MKGLVIQGKHEKGGGRKEPCVDSQAAGGSRTVGVKWSMEVRYALKNVIS